MSGTGATQGPRVLLSNAPFHHRPLEDAFAVAAEAGFDGVELMVTGDRTTQQVASVAALSATYRMPVPVVHGPFLLLTRQVFGSDPLEKAARTCALAQALGADLVIVHPPFRWQAGFREGSAQTLVGGLFGGSCCDSGRGLPNLALLSWPNGSTWR